MRLLLGATVKRGGLSWEKLLVQDTLAGGVLGGGPQGTATSRDRTASVSGGGRIKSVPMPAVGGAGREGQEGRGWIAVGGRTTSPHTNSLAMVSEAVWLLVCPRELLATHW